MRWLDADTATKRAWAKAAGWAVGERGALSTDVHNAFIAARVSEGVQRVGVGVNHVVRVAGAVLVVRAAVARRDRQASQAS